ncbi:GntR family transcriptional regulator [Bradyrhizobium sp. SSUT18]|uniref:GntR family transcriptional regulator n=1 Tax=Bradyrhizobium sp. SSUT18 TaxID=3040602 RepID=UPI00244836F8|nr:GntR family transcriptional regulator [Bradyrhizobium sp. SSUT18]MDH2401827.1 GntR family transcriptional regulator [Bradyrhizobium sp. SSUT18]
MDILLDLNDPKAETCGKSIFGALVDLQCINLVWKIMAAAETSKTLIESVYGNMRYAIMTGGLLPGQRLKISQLCEEYGVSLSIVREALTRLAAEKLVRSQPQHGFTITALSPNELKDLTFVRIQIESIALRRTLELGNLDWESRLIAAHHRLTNTPVAPKPNLVNPDFVDAHRLFHATLVDGCDSPMLIDICRSMYDASEMYRRLSYVVTNGKSGRVGEHRAIMDAALSRNADRTISLLAKHYQGTTDRIVKSGVLEAKNIGDAA